MQAEESFFCCRSEEQTRCLPLWLLLSGCNRQEICPAKRKRWSHDQFNLPGALNNPNPAVHQHHCHQWPRGGHSPFWISSSAGVLWTSLTEERIRWWQTKWLSWHLTEHTRDTGPVQSHLHISPVCARCLQSAATVPPLLGRRSYRLLGGKKNNEGGGAI